MAKLLLDIEPDVIEKINKVALEKHLSVSKIAEDLFRNAVELQPEPDVTMQKPQNAEPAYDVKKKLEDYPEWIQRIVLSKEPTADFDHKAEYGKHLEEKYGL